MEISRDVKTYRLESDGKIPAQVFIALKVGRELIRVDREIYDQIKVIYKEFLAYDGTVLRNKKGYVVFVPGAESSATLFHYSNSYYLKPPGFDERPAFAENPSSAEI